jgi:hypothetical protein
MSVRALLPVGFSLGVALAAEPAARPAISVKLGGDGRLTYAADEAGNLVIDFSHAGYAGGGGDQLRIQQTIDLVAAMPPGADGWPWSATPPSQSQTQKINFCS